MKNQTRSFLRKIVDFGKDGAVGFIAKVKALARDSSIDIVLDSVSGDSVGTCSLPAPDPVPTWKDIHCKLKRTKGVHDVFLKFNGASPDDLMNIDTVRFSKD